MSPSTTLLYIRTPMLDIAYEAHGPAGGEVVILLHGFPYDPRGYDAVAPVLAGAGYRVLVPYLRGYGPTRFAHAQVMRSGQHRCARPGTRRTWGSGRCVANSITSCTRG